MKATQTWEYSFTVFTPTFNRASMLYRVHNSLKVQTFRDFEWLVIDDGSTDDTCEMVAQWQKLSHFPIKYIYQQNSGKHAAHNLAVREARGELFLPLDSDDECVPQALERLKYHWNSVPEDQKSQFCGIFTLCVNQEGKLVGDRFPQDVMDCKLLEILYKYRVRGEKWAAFRTDVLREFPFPILHGYRFYVPEGIVWYAVSQKFKARFVNEPLRIYWYDETGRSDQVTSTQLPSKHAIGMALSHQSILNRNISWFRYAPEEFLRSAVHYARFSFHTGRGALGQLKQLDNALAKVLWATTLPIGVLAYWKDRK